MSPTRSNDDLSQLFESWLSTFRPLTKASGCEIDVQIIKNDEVNAYASILDCQHFVINIYDGLIQSLRANISASFTSFYSPDILGFEASVQSEHLTRVVDGLVEAALYYVLAHEFAHIGLGHLDHLTHTTGFCRLYEAGDTPGLKPIEFQALEHQADLFALFSAVSAHRPGHRWQPWSDTASIGLPNTFSILGMAMTFLMHTLERSTESIISARDSDHHHPAIRWFVATTNMIHYSKYELVASETRGRIGEWIEAAYMAEHMLEKLPLGGIERPPADEISLEGLRSEQVRIAEQIQAMSHILTKEMEPHRRVPINYHPLFWKH